MFKIRRPNLFKHIFSAENKNKKWRATIYNSDRPKITTYNFDPSSL